MADVTFRDGLKQFMQALAASNASRMPVVIEPTRVDPRLPGRVLKTR